MELLKAGSTDPVVAEILALEKARCRAIVERDMATLRALLTEELVHTHTRGNTQNLAEYLAYIEHEMVFRSVERHDLQVCVYSDTAIVWGRLTNTVRKHDDREFVRVEAQALQVWIRLQTGWRQAAFQATALGPPVKMGTLE
jgi:hypothetical protein